jgi:hypothetical protein
MWTELVPTSIAASLTPVLQEVSRTSDAVSGSVASELQKNRLTADTVCCAQIVVNLAMLLLRAWQLRRLGARHAAELVAEPSRTR